MRSRDLAYYKKLFQFKSFTKVADYFHISQPTVTAAVQRLEQELGARLLIRDQSHKELIFTKSGVQFEKHVETVLSTLETAKSEIQSLQTEKIRFGLPPIIGSYYFPRLSEYLIHTKKISALEVDEDGSHSLLSKLIKGDLDMTLIGSLHPVSGADNHLVVQTLARRKFKLIVSPQHSLAQKKAVFFNEFKRDLFVQFNERFVHPRAFRAFCQVSHTRPKVICSLSDLQIIKGMVMRNLAVSLLVELAIQRSEQIVALPLQDIEQPDFFISIAYRSTHVLTESQQQILEWFSSALSE